LAHLWLGQSALSDLEPVSAPVNNVEDWCNRVAAELLVPLDALKQAYQIGEELPGAVNRLARQFKVSTLVVLRRIHDAGGLTRDQC
jgi:Zn-dependent peptidase ImmA (M78 family)